MNASDLFYRIEALVTYTEAFVELDFFDNANETRLGTGASFTYCC